MLGAVELIQLRAVWRGYRWGVYGLFGIFISELVLSCWGDKSPAEILGSLKSTVYNELPLIFLFLLVRPKWKAMR